MKTLQLHLENMGYVSGLTMLAMPYDWRLHNDDDAVTQMIPRVIKLMSNFSNKKVTIVAHSMGNFRALNALYEMEPKFKEKYVKRFVSMAPPFMGVSKSIFQMLCGNSDLDYDFFFGFKVGIHPKGFATLFSNFESIYQLLPNDALNKNKGKEWVKQIKNRIRYEKELRKPRGRELDRIFDWFPRGNEICYKDGDGSGNRMCNSGLESLMEFGSVGNDGLYAQYVKEILEKYAFVPKENIKRGFARL